MDASPKSSPLSLVAIIHIDVIDQITQTGALPCIEPQENLGHNTFQAFKSSKQTNLPLPKPSPNNSTFRHRAVIFHGTFTSGKCHIWNARCFSQQNGSGPKKGTGTTDGSKTNLSPEPFTSSNSTTIHFNCTSTGRTFRPLKNQFRPQPASSNPTTLTDNLRNTTQARPPPLQLHSDLTVRNVYNCW